MLSQTLVSSVLIPTLPTGQQLSGSSATWQVPPIAVCATGSLVVEWALPMQIGGVGKIESRLVVIHSC